MFKVREKNKHKMLNNAVLTADERVIMKKVTFEK
jgi:hypothetical protein